MRVHSKPAFIADTLRHLFWIVAVGTVVVIGAQLLPGHHTPVPEQPLYTATTAPPTAGAEDDPDWDCTTQGNQVCGTPDPVVTTPAGQYADLELCQYAYLHGYSTSAEYLSCTHGLHADESRTTQYTWQSGGVLRTDPTLEARLGRLP